MNRNDKTKTQQDQPLMNERTGDLPDSPRDEERLQPDEAILDLPEVKDIPGQEHIHPPSLGELADTTISSDDEEGKSIFGDDTDETYSLNKGDTTQIDNSTEGNP